MPKYLRKLQRFVTANELNSPSQWVNIQETQLYDKVTKVEEQIHSRLFEAKKFRANFSCEHTHIKINKTLQQKILNSQDQNQINQYFTDQANRIVGDYNSETNYYDKFWKLFMMNEMTKKKVDHLKQSILKINEINSDVSRSLEQRQLLFKNAAYKGIKKEKKKTYLSDDCSNSIITKKYVCSFPECYKHYASEVSLAIHLKSKHQQKKNEPEQHIEQNCQPHRMMKRNRPIIIQQQQDKTFKDEKDNIYM